MTTVSFPPPRVKANQPVPPVRGSAVWVKPLLLPGGLGRLRITAHTKRGPVTAGYDVEATYSPDGRRLLGFSLATDSDDIYSIDITWGEGQWVCDCGDCCFRSRECKHSLALRAVLIAAGQLPAERTVAHV